MKKFIKAVKEFKKFKNFHKIENTFIVYDSDKNDYIIFINWSKEYLQNNYHFIDVY
jgi:hypothetical protein